MAVKQYDSVVLCGSEVAFLGEGKNVTFRSLLYCILFVGYVAKSEKYIVKFSCLPYFKGYFVDACSFSVFNFSFQVLLP